MTEINREKRYIKNKSAVIGFSYLLGLIGASFLNEIYSYLICALLIAAALLSGFIKNGIAGYLTAFFLVMGIGFGVFGIYRQVFCVPLYELDGKTAEISGRVVSKNDIGNDTAGYVLEAEIDGKTALISVLGTDTDAEYGDVISLKARFNLPRDNAAFNEEEYYSSKGIVLKAAAASSISVTKTGFKGFEHYIYEFNSYIKSKILEAMPNDAGGLLCALFLGDKSHISERLKESIKRSGVAHYTAVSGFHLTLMAHIFTLMLGLTPLRNKRKSKYAVMALIILIFMFFFKLSPSVVRAGIMLLVFYGGDIFMRRGSTVNSLGFAVLLILIVSPYACRDMGLLLSAAGTFGVGVLAPAINKKIKTKRFRVAGEAFIGTICAVYCTLPFSALFFKGVSVASPVTNIILQPFLQTALATVAVFAVLGGIFMLPLFIAGIMSKITVDLIQFFGELKYSYFPLDYDFLLPWAAAAFVFVAAAAITLKRTDYTVKAGIVTVFVLAGMILVYDRSVSGDTEIYVYSDGGAGVVAVKYRSDCVIIVTDDSPDAYAYAQGFIKNNFLDEASVLCLLGSTKNMSGSFYEIPGNVYIPPSESEAAYDVSGKLRVYRRGGRITINCMGYFVVIDGVKSEEAFLENADLQIIYGYSQKIAKPQEIPAEIIYISRRMVAEDENEYNAYYESVKRILRKNEN